MSNIDKTIKYVQDLFDKSEYLKDKPKQKEYRLEHTYRVASIGKEIAQKENLDIDALVVGCLLHDISYIYEMESEDDSLNHGRKSAQIAREFVMGLDMDAKLKNELLYGIAIHVDDKADFEGERTVLAESIGEADNIDRFDRYRLYENLLYSNLSNMSLDEQMGYASKRVERLKNLKKYVFRTKTSNRMWNEKLDYQIGYYEGLLEQLQKSDCEKL
ncbi:MAG TPA: HD domain-containing protein [Bacillota bacterium]|nr:HD domain-containing protein [Bacillota bacterium]